MHTHMLTVVLVTCLAVTTCSAQRSSWSPVRTKHAWDPQQSMRDWGFPSLDDAFSDPFFSGSWLKSMTGQEPAARGIVTDFLETADKFQLKADLPGVPKDAIKVDVEGDVLSISVDDEKCENKVEERDGVKWHRVERSASFQKRSLRLPESAVMDKIEAKHDNGVLTLTVPKVEAKAASAAKRITVK